MNSKIWFILSEGQVAGPYDQAEAESHLGSAKEAQIWGRGQSEWMTPSNWRKFIKEGGSDSSRSSEVTGLWRIRVEGQEKEPLSYPELISFLKTLPDLSVVDISSEKGGGGWRDVYAVPRIAEDLGISRRSHARVPLVGTLTCQGKNGEFTCRVISISEGGLGVNDAKDLRIGQQFNATLTSANLFVTITTTCEVVYVGADGYAGLRFVGLPTEFKSSIIEYVNKFTTT